ncbi:hypothetical protein HRbin01_00035 [archaeon HR01]|nr:hypothetical protein HRbin01_00035 [archaeon HR01]
MSGWERLQVIYGSLLGDAWLDKPADGNARLQVRHSIKQRGYVEFKNRVLKPLSLDLIFYEYLDRRTGKTYRQVGFNTRRHPLFTYLRLLFYNNGVKTFPVELFDDMDEIALAIFIGDDGTFDKNAGTVKISVDSYRLRERELIRAWLERKFSLKTTLQKDRVYVLKSSLPTLVKIVSQYMPESIHYKLSPP